MLGPLPPVTRVFCVFEVIMNIDLLIEQFEYFDTTVFNDYKHIISSKVNGEIFPPYVPHVGCNFSKYNLMMYGMAQNISKPWPSLLNKNKVEKVRQLYDVSSYKDIWIAPYRIMLAVAGVHIYAKYGDALESFSDIHNAIAATNYYKFSLNDNRTDINPDGKLFKYISPNIYWEENDRLSQLETDTLKPKTIISFKGRHNNVLKRGNVEFININDPSWILRGGGGHLKASGSWYRDLDDSGVHKIVESYLEQLEQIDDKYAAKTDAVRIYLLRYYSDWVNT